MRCCDACDSVCHHDRAHSFSHALTRARTHPNPHVHHADLRSGCYRRLLLGHYIRGRLPRFLLRLCSGRRRCCGRKTSRNKITRRGVEAAGLLRFVGGSQRVSARASACTYVGTFRLSFLSQISTHIHPTISLLQLLGSVSARAESLK